MKKLYEVNILMYVMAEDEADAKSAAFGPYVDHDSCDVEVFEPGSFMAHWENSIPFNSDDARTVGEIIRVKREAENESPKS